MSEPMKLYRDVTEAGLDDWRMLAQGIHARFTTGSFATGLSLVAAIGEAAEAVNHHPDVTLTYPRVDVTLNSHDVGYVTQRDLDLAARISEAARGLGVGSDPDSLAQIEAALDAPSPAAIQPFWRAAFGYDPIDDSPDELRDTFGRNLNVWFQESGTESDRQRWHYDVFIPGDQVQARIEAIIAAGGTLVGEYPDHSYWVLADADGNKMCVCTSEGRGENPEE
jgi:4a-hydroxytetrahydrobiopterin dehydratase